MSELNVISLNCRGLGDISKRRDVLNYLKSKQYSIVCLQDTHLTEKDKTMVRSCGVMKFFSVLVNLMPEE